MTTKCKYAYEDDSQVLIGEIEAWTIAFGRWAAMKHTEAFCNVRLVSKADFEEMFPNLPLLPPEAFAD